MGKKRGRKGLEPTSTPRINEETIHGIFEDEAKLERDPDEDERSYMNLEVDEDDPLSDIAKESIKAKKEQEKEE